MWAAACLGGQSRGNSDGMLRTSPLYDGLAPQFDLVADTSGSEPLEAELIENLVWILTLPEAAVVTA